MSVDTKGFVATRNKSPFFILGLIEASINHHIGSLRKRIAENREFKDIADPYWSSPSIRLNPSSKSASINFVYKGEARQLFVTFTTDTDRKEYTDSSVSLMLGCWGSSELLMKTVLNALRPLGDVYFLLSDASDEPFEKLDIPLMSYTEACRQHLVQPSYFSLQEWVQEFRTGTLAAPTEQEAFGFSLDEALQIIEMPYEDGVKRLKELAGMLEAA